MPPPAEFHAFGASHGGAIIVTLLATAFMVGVARLGWKRFQRTLEISLAVVLLLLWPLTWWYCSATGTLTVNNRYPCHLCDLAGFLGAFTLFTRKTWACELLYFWGLAGTIQGLITPALTLDYPHPRYFAFFLLHGGVVTAALYGVLGLRHTPRAQAKWVAWGLINIYALVVGAFNWLVQANYGFLGEKPATASLYDLLGPWPWYIVSASFMALGIFLILDLPFAGARYRAKNQQVP